MTNEELFTYGEGLYNILCEKRNIQFIVCPCSFGDTINVSVFMSSYKQSHNINTVILVIKKSHENLSRMFKYIDGVFPIEDYEMWALRIYMAVTQKYNDNNVLYGTFKPTDLSFSDIKITKELNFVDEYKTQVLDIPISSRCDSVIIGSNNSDYSDSVLLLPYARTYKMINEIFWKNLASNYLKQGKKVYTNVGPCENPITSTIPLELPISELCSCAKTFYKIIGLRSGIMDALALTGCSMDVIYTGLNIQDLICIDEINLSTNLLNLNPNAKVHNYSYHPNTEKQLIDILCKESK